MSFSDVKRSMNIVKTVMSSFSDAIVVQNRGGKSKCGKICIFFFQYILKLSMLGNLELFELFVKSRQN
jgi:hypothetical protein